MCETSWAELSKWKTLQNLLWWMMLNRKVLREVVRSMIRLDILYRIHIYGIYNKKVMPWCSESLPSDASPPLRSVTIAFEAAEMPAPRGKEKKGTRLLGGQVDAFLIGSKLESSSSPLIAWLAFQVELVVLSSWKARLGFPRLLTKWNSVLLC